VLPYHVGRGQAQPLVGHLLEVEQVNIGGLAQVGLLSQAAVFLQVYPDNIHYQVKNGFVAAQLAHAGSSRHRERLNLKRRKGRAGPVGSSPQAAVHYGSPNISPAPKPL